MFVDWTQRSGVRVASASEINKEIQSVMKIQLSIISYVIQERCHLILCSVGDGRMSVGHWWNDINSGNR